MHGAQRRLSSLVLGSAKQCPILGLSHCKLGLAMSPALFFWPLKPYSLLKCGQCCKSLPWAFSPDIHGMEWVAGVCSQSWGQAAAWGFSIVNVPPLRLSTISPGWRLGRVPSEKHLSLCSLSWQLFVEIGRGRFLLPIQGNLMSSLLQTEKISPSFARKCF